MKIKIPVNNLLDGSNIIKIWSNDSNTGTITKIIILESTEAESIVETLEATKVTEAATAVGNAELASLATVAMASDNIFSIQEKADWRIRWPAIQAGYEQVLTVAESLNVSTVNLTIVRTTLYNLLNITHTIWTADPVDSLFLNTVFIDAVTSYESELQYVVNQMAEAALVTHNITDGADVTIDNTSADTTLVAGSVAADVKNNAANANIAVVAMEADNKFSIVEKELWQVNWYGMLANYTRIWEEAGNYGIQGDTVFTYFTIAKGNLYDFLNTDHNVFAVSPAASPITAGDITTVTTAFYDTMQLALNRLAEYQAYDSISGIKPPSDADKTSTIDLAAQINVNTTTISGGKITTGSILAGKIFVTNLASIKSDLGAITAGSLNIGSGKFVVDTSGNVAIKSATTGERMEIANDTVKVYDSSGVLRVLLGDLT